MHKEADRGRTKPSGGEGGWLGRIRCCYRSGVAALPADLREGRDGSRCFQLFWGIKKKHMVCFMWK